MSKKPYMYEHLEWLEIFQRKDWNDPTVNPDDLAEYSEFNKPYAQPDKEDTYVGWEMTWPNPNWPDIPPLVIPDPVESPCNIEDSCAGVGIIGPAEMECEKCYPYTHAHVILSCEPAWWMAFGSWTLEVNTSGGNCYFAFADPLLIATVCCEEGAAGSFTLTYNGPLECTDSITVEVTCEDCVDCEEFTLEGTGSIVHGQNWVGIISPACPQLTCEDHVSVSSNSGCTFGCAINEAGSELTISGTGGKCGTVTVSISLNPDAHGCEERTASDSFRITGAGDWEIVTTDGGGPACQEEGCNCGCGGSGHGNCIVEPYRYGSGCEPWTFANCCFQGWSSQCKGKNPPGCSGSNGPAPCPPGARDCSSAGCTCDGSPCNVGGGCCCARHAWWICEWQCEC